jgi:Rrf2 family protein
MVDGSVGRAIIRVKYNVIIYSGAMHSLFSATCSYGVQAVLYLAAHASREGYTPIQRISTALDISHSFLTKVLQRLKSSGIVSSRRGPNGGVALAQDPKALSLKDVIVALDEEAIFTECVLGLQGCGTTMPCPLHDSWSCIRTDIEHLFRTTTLADAADHPSEILAVLEKSSTEASSD